MINMINSGKQEGQQTDNVAPRYMYEIYGEPRTKSIKEWRQFILAAGKEKDIAERQGDKATYKMALAKIFYGWLAKRHLQKLPWDNFREKEYWKKLEIPK